MTDLEKVEALEGLVIFLANTWSQVDDFVYKHCDGDALMKYPVVQGTRNQMDLRTIGSQEPSSKQAIRDGVSIMLGKE